MRARATNRRAHTSAELQIARDVTNDSNPASTTDLGGDRFALVSRLADDIGHEVKNPLHAMVINLELLKRRVSTGQQDDALKRIQMVEREIVRVHELIEALIEFLRPPRDDSDHTELDTALDDLMPLLRVQAHLAHIELEYEPAGEGAVVALPRDALRHLVLGVVTRALDGVRGRDGGRLTIRGAHSDADTRLRITAEVPGSGTGLEPPRPTATGAGATEVLMREAGGTLQEETSESSSSNSSFLLRFPARLSA